MAPNLQKFCRSLAAAKLVTPAELEKHYRQWRSAAPEHRNNLVSFAKSLIQSGKVTEIQIAKLLKDLNGQPEVPASLPIDVELIMVDQSSRKFDRRDLLFALAGAAVAAAIIIPTMSLTRSKK